MTERPFLRFRGVIFDFDGTIADTLPICIEAFQATFAHYGGPDLDADGIRALFGPSEEGVLTNVLGERGDQALSRYLDEYTKLHTSVPRPFPGIAPLLDALVERGVALGIVTGKGAGSVRISLDYIGLGGYFDPVEAGSPQGSIKAEAMTRAAHRWGFDPDAIVGVGDHITDVRHARIAGIHPVGVVWAHPRSAELLAAEDPEQLFASVDAFSAWLLEHV